MKHLKVYFQDQYAGLLKKIDQEPYVYEFEYNSKYTGPAISLTMPLSQKKYICEKLPSFFDNLLPEGQQLKTLLKNYNILETDYFQQLLVLGEDLIGAITIQASKT